jgi:hypothetical protein
MLKATLLMVSLIAVLFSGSVLTAESSSAAPEPKPTQGASSEVLPDAITSQLTPEPTFKYFVQSGPCTATVTCDGNFGPYTINCYGQNVCKWKVDNRSSPYMRGFVECDNGYRLTCGSGSLPPVDP